MSTADPRKQTAAEQWAEFDQIDISLISIALLSLDPETLAPEARSRLIELQETFTQRITGYISEA